MRRDNTHGFLFQILGCFLWIWPITSWFGGSNKLAGKGFDKIVAWWCSKVPTVNICKYTRGILALFCQSSPHIRGHGMYAHTIGYGTFSDAASSYLIVWRCVECGVSMVHELSQRNPGFCLLFAHIVWSSCAFDIEDVQANRVVKIHYVICWYFTNLQKTKNGANTGGTAYAALYQLQQVHFLFSNLFWVTYNQAQASRCLQTVFPMIRLYASQPLWGCMEMASRRATQLSWPLAPMSKTAKASRAKLMRTNPGRLAVSLCKMQKISTDNCLRKPPGWDMKHWYTTLLSSFHRLIWYYKPQTLASGPDRRARVPWPQQPQLRILASKKVDPSHRFPLRCLHHQSHCSMLQSSMYLTNVTHCCCFMSTLIEAKQQPAGQEWLKHLPSTMFSDSSDFLMSSS